MRVLTIACVLTVLVQHFTAQEEFSCPEPGGFFPHEEDCTAFYHCEEGRATLSHCAEQLHYNPIISDCDWPLSDKCEKGEYENAVVYAAWPEESEEAHLVVCPSKVCVCNIAHPHDCTSYFRCENGRPKKKRCAKGLYFNPVTQVCDHQSKSRCKSITTRAPPTTTKKPGFNCPDDSGLYPDPKSCRHFYHCSHYFPHRKECPANLHFNPKLQVCDWPDKAGCGSGVGPIRPPPIGDCPCDCCLITDWNDCSKYFLCLDGKKHHMACSEGLFFNHKTENCDIRDNLDRWCPLPTKPPTPVTTKRPGGWRCPSVNGLFPHPTECGKFYHCSHDVPHLKDCPANLHFNPKLQVCDWPDRAGCGSGVGPIRPPPIGDCPCDCCLITDWNDCSKYFLCLDGKKHHMACSEGLFFNHKTENCDIRDNLDRWCPLPTKPPTPVTTKRPGGWRCPSVNGLFPHPTDCGKFYHCAHDVPHLKDCPANLHFNPKLLVCDWPDRAGCGVPCIPEIPVEVGDCNCDCCMITDWNDCSKYFLCLGGKKHPMSCPKDLFFNHLTETCDRRENLDRWCPLPTKPPTPVTTKRPGGWRCPSINGLFPHPTECGKFYHCSHDVPHLKDCPANLHFNPKLLVCDWPDRAGCGTSVGPELPPGDGTCNCECCLQTDWNDCSKYFLCLGRKKYHMTCSAGLFFNHKTENCDLRENLDRWCPEVTSKRPPITPSPICVDPNGLYPHPKHCSKFMHCSNGIVYEKDCPKSLHWSKAIKRCEWPCIAKCDANVRPCTTPAPATTPRPGGGCSCRDCLLPDPSDCSSYYRCSGGKPTKTKCPSGQLFDRNAKRCAPKDTVKCETTGDPEYCLQPTGFFPLPGKCAYFVHCVDGVANIKQCPSKTEFNPDLGVCDWPNGKCGGTGSDKRCPRPQGLFPHPTHCDKFLHCDHGVAYPKDCPPTLHFNAKLRVCDWPRNVNCKDNHWEDNTNNEDNFVWGCNVAAGVTCPPCACRIPNFDSCEAFYQCTEDGKACAKTCPEGLHFNKDTRVCDLPANAKCK